MFLEGRNQHRAVHYSFRTNEDIFSAIEKEAESKGISVSSLLNQIIAKYVKCDRYFEQLGFIPISKDVLKKWLDRIEERFVVEDAKQLGSTIAREYVSYFFQDVNKYTLLEFLDLWFSRFESYQHKVNGNVHSFAINHNVSTQYSIYMKEFLKVFIESIISREVKFLELTPNVVSFTFEAN